MGHENDIFKIFFYLLDYNYENLKNYGYPNHGIHFYEEFKDIFDDKIDKIKEHYLQNYLLPKGEEYNKYKEVFELLDHYKNNEENLDIKQSQKKIENYGIDFIYSISNEIIISYLNKIDSDEYLKYSSLVQKLFDNELNLPEITKKLFLLYFNQTIFEKIMKKDRFKIDLLLYGLRICLKISNTNNPNEFFYSKLLTEKVKEAINENVIPGEKYSDNVDNVFIKGFNDLKNHFKKYESNFGAYICSCGAYYNNSDSYDNPLDDIHISCKNCQEHIGNEPGVIPYALIKREGHYRIFKNKEEKEEEVKRVGDQNYDETTPNILFEEYKTKFIDPIIEEEKYGINKMNRIIFQTQNNMTEIYLLLDIDYCILFFIHIYFFLIV